MVKNVVAEVRAALKNRMDFGAENATVKNAAEARRNGLQKAFLSDDKW